MFSAQGELCDGSVLSIKSKCCEGDQIKGCPAGAGKCTDFNFFSKLSIWYHIDPQRLRTTTQEQFIMVCLSIIFVCGDALFWGEGERQLPNFWYFLLNDWCRVQNLIYYSPDRNMKGGQLPKIQSEYRCNSFSNIFINKGDQYNAVLSQYNVFEGQIISFIRYVRKF